MSFTLVFLQFICVGKQMRLQEQKVDGGASIGPKEIDQLISCLVNAVIHTVSQKDMCTHSE